MSCKLINYRFRQMCVKNFHFYYISQKKLFHHKFLDLVTKILERVSNNNN